MAGPRWLACTAVGSTYKRLANPPIQAISGFDCAGYRQGVYELTAVMKTCLLSVVVANGTGRTLLEKVDRLGVHEA